MKPLFMSQMIDDRATTKSSKVLGKTCYALGTHEDKQTTVRECYSDISFMKQVNIQRRYFIKHQEVDA